MKMSWKWENEVANNIQSARIESGFTQQELGIRCGLRVSAISHFECGRRVPSLKNFHKLCEALQVNPDYLLPVVLENEGCKELDSADAYEGEEERADCEGCNQIDCPACNEELR